MKSKTKSLRGDALASFLALTDEAVASVSQRFLAERSEVYRAFGDRGRKVCAEDMAFTLEFLRPAVEFGFVQPFVDYVQWLQGVLESRSIPADHVPLSLQWLEEFYCERLPREAVEVIGGALRAARSPTAAKADALGSIYAKMPKAWAGHRSFEKALLAGDHEWGWAILRERLRAGIDPLEIELHLFQPALYQVGRDWQENRISVAREHLATSTAIMLMSQLALECDPAPAIDRKILLACVAGNHHAVGLRMVADAFEWSGWEVRYLGADVPTSALVEEVVEQAPDLLGLSVSLPFHLRTAREAVGALRMADGGGGPAVMLGGLAINCIATMPESFGVAGNAPDASAALSTAEQILAARG